MHPQPLKWALAGVCAATLDCASPAAPRPSPESGRLAGLATTRTEVTLELNGGLLQVFDEPRGRLVVGPVKVDAHNHHLYIRGLEGTKIEVPGQQPGADGFLLDGLHLAAKANELPEGLPLEPLGYAAENPNESGVGWDNSFFVLDIQELAQAATGKPHGPKDDWDKELNASVSLSGGTLTIMKPREVVTLKNSGKKVPLADVQWSLKPDGTGSEYRRQPVTDEVSYRGHVNGSELHFVTANNRMTITLKPGLNGRIKASLLAKLGDELEMEPGGALPHVDTLYKVVTDAQKMHVPPKQQIIPHLWVPTAWNGERAVGEYCIGGRIRVKK
jgi:hypothetical protein